MTILNRVALILNAVTLIIVLSAMGYFWMREVWLVDHLEARFASPPRKHAQLAWLKLGPLCAAERSSDRPHLKPESSFLPPTMARRSPPRCRMITS